MADARTLECDLVMKGGVTSGVVYPGAIARIAREYRLRSIGGTSAGAIGAVVAAAMEYGIAKGQDPAAACQKLLAVTHDLGCRTDRGTAKLQELFAAEPGTSRLFKAAMHSRSAGVLAAVLGFGREALALALLAALALGGGLHLLGQGWLAALLAGVLVFALLAGLGLWITLRASLNAMVANGLGLCRGSATSGASCGGQPVPSLLQWLHATTQTLAGESNGVLTFGQLWNPADPANARRSGPRQLDLVLVASDLNRLQSVSFPSLPDNQRLFLDREEWAGIFPAPVMAAIAAKAWQSGPVPDGVGFAAADIDQAAAASGVPRDRLLLLPRAADLPVLVAARASMAFPGLFTPVPLWLLRWVPDGAGGKAPVLSRVLLADGGITSNFPIHLFDSPLPGRPTFALNLLYEGEDVAEARPPSGTTDGNQTVPEQVTGLADDGMAALAAVFMPFTNRGRVGYYQPPAQGSGFAQIAGLLGRVVDTARMWGDVGLFDQPGVRDRIAHIRLASDEGGFNLNMPAETIKRLSDKGALAGDVLASRFHPSAPSDPLANGAMPRLNWQNHRFVRLRATLAAQQQLAARFALRWPAAVPATAQQQPGPADLLAGANGQWQAPGGPAFPIGYSFNLTKAERGRLASLADNLAGLALPPASQARNDQPPRPRAILQMRPDTTDGR